MWKLKFSLFFIIKNSRERVRQTHFEQQATNAKFDFLAASLMKPVTMKYFTDVIPNWKIKGSSLQVFYLETSCRSRSQTNNFFMIQGISKSSTGSSLSFLLASMASMTNEAENRQTTSKSFSSYLFGLSLLDPFTSGTCVTYWGVKRMSRHPAKWPNANKSLGRTF